MLGSKRRSEPSTKGDPVNTARSYVRYLVGAIAVFALGLAIGYSQGDDPTFFNSVSKVLLSVGFLAVVITGALQLITRVRAALSRP
jgi:hypothetical protein